MPFVCSLDPDSELDLDVITISGEFIVRLAIGYDDENGKTFSIAVALSPLPGGFMELSFSVISLCQASGDWSDFWDGLATKPLIPLPKDRDLIRSGMLSCVATLVDEVRPEIVSMTTHTENLPEIALGRVDEFSTEDRKGIPSWNQG